MRSFALKQHQAYEWESLNVTPHPKRTGLLRQAHPILDLQRTHGNRVMQRFLHANAQTLYRQPLPNVTPPPPPLTARLIGAELLDGFALNSATLTKDHKDRLAILAHTLKDLLEAYPAGTVQITGHTDATGDDDLNERLGQQRADAVSDFLLEKGVSAAALASLSAGERQLRIKTNSPEPRNRRAEVRFDPAPKTRFLQTPESTEPEEEKGQPGTTTLEPKQLCAERPELCDVGPPPPPAPRGTEPPARCPSSMRCYAISSEPFDRQPPDLQRVLGASFPDPAEWFGKLDRDQRMALVAIYNRLCELGLWCRVRQVLAVHPGEAPVSIWGVKFKVPGLSVSVDFVADDNKAVLDALIGSGTSCVDTGLGGSLHAGQSSLREQSPSESMHTAVGSRNLFDVHIDKFSSPAGGASISCVYNVPATGAHLGREVFPEKFRALVRWLTSWMKVGPLPIARDIARTVTSGVQVFPDFSLTPNVPQPEPLSRQDVFPPVWAGITLEGPMKEERRHRSNLPSLPPDVQKVLDEEIPRRIRQNALVPSEAQRRVAAATAAREMAGKDDEDALIAALEAARERLESFATNAHYFANNLALLMADAGRNGRPAVAVHLGKMYEELSAPDRQIILDQVRDIARILRALLGGRAAGVYKVWVLFDTVMWEVDF
jgi:outer membrane protein OmpA-like peptidoglycan-associated protein